MEDDIQAVRRGNLAKLLHDRYRGEPGAQAKLAADTDYTPAYISQLLKGKHGGRSFGEKTARRVERRLKLCHGWFDLVDHTPVEIGGPVDERLGVLPEALRQYVLEQLLACETVYRQTPWAFDTPIKSESYDAFHAHLQFTAAQLRRVKTDAGAKN